ncbi:MAG: hypothetical protein FWC58_01650 [Desulfobulbus sp.]|nr:hypothetical protein [Desulfobulbus sp.]
MKFLIPALLVLAGCASWHWEKRGASAADYDLDEKYCKLQTYSGTEGLVTNASVRRMHACLEAKGWSKVAN